MIRIQIFYLNQFKSSAKTSTISFSFYLVVFSLAAPGTDPVRYLFALPWVNQQNKQNAREVL